MPAAAYRPCEQSGLYHEDTFRIEDSFPGTDQFLEIVANAGGRIEQFHDALRPDIARRGHQVPHRKEHTQTGRIDDGEGVLPVLNELGLTLPAKGVDQQGDPRSSM